MKIILALFHLIDVCTSSSNLRSSRKQTSIIELVKNKVRKSNMEMKRMVLH